MRHQQNVAVLPFAVVVLRPRRKLLEDLLALMPEVLRLLLSMRPGTVTEVFPTLPA